MPAEASRRRLDRPRLYRLQLALGGAGLAGSTLVLAAAVRSVHVRPASAHRLDVGGARFTYPEVNAAAVALLLLAVLGAAVLLVTARAASRQLRGHRRVMRTLPIRGPLRRHPDVCVVDAPVPLAFCAGWMRPSVYISTGAIDRLSETELEAVLAHERQHRAVRDPLRLAVTRVLSQALFFLPVLRPLHDRYGEVAEVAADAAALRAVDGRPAPLASAMLAFGASGSGGVVGISPGRVDSLLGRPRAWRLPWALLLAALLTMAALVALAWRASGTASAQASLNLPVASSQPCLLVLALVPVLACGAAVLVRGLPSATAAGSLAPR